MYWIRYGHKKILKVYTLEYISLPICQSLSAFGLTSFLQFKISGTLGWEPYGMIRWQPLCDFFLADFKSKTPGPDSRNDRSRSDQIWSCDHDQPIAFHKRRSRSAHQIEKIRNQIVNCQLNHDINHSLGNLLLKLRHRYWTKNVRLMIYVHDVTMGGEVTSFMSADTRVLWPVQCMHTVLLTIQHGLHMPHLTGMCDKQHRKHWISLITDHLWWESVCVY